MADPPLVVLRAHDLTSAAATVEQARLQAISVDGLTRLSLRTVSAGRTRIDCWP
ncbi:hypothetical protein [Streptomyces sp. NPDC050546]|uniref:hypothetical protein n=1 Tax=Streptomyces sp. NPDC050546 TaxID=3365628 RepID=UPI0037B0A6FB